MSWCDPCAANPLSTEGTAQGRCVLGLAVTGLAAFQQMQVAPGGQNRLRCCLSFIQRRAFFPHAPSRRVVARNR